MLVYNKAVCQRCEICPAPWDRVGSRLTLVRSLAALLVLALLAAAVACDVQNAATPTPDIEATVAAAIADALPTVTPTQLPDVNATITAEIAATRAAATTPTAAPAPTADIEATVEARMAANIAAGPPPTPTPVSPATLTPSPAPTATPLPSPVPTAIPRATPTARPPVGQLSQMVRQARPSVVRIETDAGSGTGVIVETQGQTGFIVTNHHVVESSGQVKIVVDDSATYTGTVHGVDHVRDLAVISICCGAFQALPFGDASLLQPGDEVIAIGYALGLSGQATITRGIVSALRYDSNRQTDVIQTDAAINPGNSGGPILSLSGEILGINTFRYDESDSGRPAEGLGFAISERTVQSRIPALKTGTAAPAPTPTRRPDPTPAPTVATGYGPSGGELWHDPDDGFIKTDFAGVTTADFVAYATFQNPYSPATNPWDYGFVFRDNLLAPNFHIVVTSAGNWEILFGEQPPRRRLGYGTLPLSFDVAAGAANTLWVSAFGSRGLFFVNGEFVAALDLSDAIQSGDIAVMTGIFQGDELAGEVTRYQDFRVVPLRRQFGPQNGILRKAPGFIAEYESNVWAMDFLVEAEFSRPPGSDWDYGFVFRSPGFDRLDIVGIEDDGSWFHETRDVLDVEYVGVDGGVLSRSGAEIRASNHLLLLAFGNEALFMVNETLVARLDLSHNMEYGWINAMADFYLDSNGAPAFENFNVWTP